MCASHGIFSKNSNELLDLSAVELVVVTDSIPLAPNASKKILQVSLAPQLAHIIEQEHFGCNLKDDSLYDSYEEDKL